MKKISILLLSLFAVVFAGIYAQPAFAAEDEATISIQVIAPGAGMDPVEFNGTYGELTNVSFVLAGYVYHIYNGQVSDASVRQFVNSKSTYVTMVLEHTSDDSVVWIDTNGKVLDYAYGDAAELEYDGVTPSKPGLAFDGWQLLQSFGKNDVYIAKYQASTEDVEIEILGGSANPEFPKYNEVVELNPEEVDFSYWADEDGQFVSANPNYKFTALTPVTLQAVFGEDVPEGPSVYLYNVSGIREGYQSFVGYVENNTEATLVEFGMLASANAEVLTLDTAGVEVLPSTIMSPNNEFLRSIIEGEYSSFRAYAVFSDGTTVYSDNNFVSGKTTYDLDFNNSTKGGYDLGDITFDGRIWSLSDALIGTDANDRKNGAKSLRIRNAGYIELKTPMVGLNYVSFYHAKYGTDANSNINLQIKISNGDWVDVKTSTVTSTTLTFFEADLSEYDITSTTEVYIKLVKSSGNRINIDDIHLVSSIDTRYYQVKFIGDNSQSTFDLPIGTKATAPASPKTGHSIASWHLNQSLNEESEFDFETEIYSHITLYAKYTPNQYTATFILNGGEMSEAFDPITYTYGVAFEQPSEPTREGYTFDGWYQNDTLTTPYTGWDGLRAQNHSIYARWSINQYTIITNEMGAPEMDDIVANYGAAVQQPSEISDYEGFLFVGWYLDEELTQEVTWPIIMPVGGITIYAKWASSENMVTVSFETNGGTPAIIDQNLPAGSTVTKPSNPSKNGFGLEGWYSNVELTEKWNFDVNTVNEDVTLYAKWVALVVMRQSDFGETNSNSSTYGNFYIDTVENGSSDPLPNGTSSWSRAGGNYNGTSWNHIRFGQNSTIPRLGDLETSNSTSNQAVHASDPNSYVATRFNLDSVIKIDMIFDLVKAGTTIHLQTSTNGTNWTAFDSITVTDAISSQTTLTFNVYSESAQYYRFVLVNATTSTNGSLAHLYTITFYGFPS